MGVSYVLSCLDPTLEGPFMSVSVRPQDLSLIRILVENVRIRAEAVASGGVCYVRRYTKRRYMRAFRGALSTH